jgi:hypothetical protein
VLGGLQCERLCPPPKRFAVLSEVVMQVSESQMRSLAAALGLGVAAFGAVPLTAPRAFGRLCGLAASDDAMASVVRSVGVRDVVMGMGLWSAATHSGKFVPWLLSRLLTDGGDVVVVSLAVAAGARQRRFLALGGLALGAALADASLYLAARQIKR